MKRRLFSRILAFILIFSLLPVNVFASTFETTEYLEDDESAVDEFDWGESQDGESTTEMSNSDSSEATTEESTTSEPADTITSTTTDDVLVLNTGDYSDSMEDGDEYVVDGEDTESQSLFSTLAAAFSLNSRATKKITLKTGDKIYSASDFFNIICHNLVKVATGQLVFIILSCILLVIKEVNYGKVDERGNQTIIKVFPNRRE